MPEKNICDPDVDSNEVKDSENAKEICDRLNSSENDKDSDLHNEDSATVEISDDVSESAGGSGSAQGHGEQNKKNKKKDSNKSDPNQKVVSTSYGL